MDDRGRLGLVFTGTRFGSQDLLVAVRETLLVHDPEKVYLITGACIGLDAAAAREGTKQGFRVHTVVPANRTYVDPYWDAWCGTYELMPPDTNYRDRDQRMVDLGDRCIAFPHRPEDHPDSRRSGTWLTVRLARRKGIPVRIVALQELLEA